MRKVLLIIFSLLFVAFTGAYFYLQPAPLPVDKLLDANQKYDVRILRDTWGVPHIFGKTDADVAHGLAYAHAEDDFATIQGALLAARGQLAAEFGKDAAPNDYMVHLMRIWDVIEAKYQTDLSPETRAICEAYADGLNYYAALHPDEAKVALYPVHGEDLVAGFLHKVPLFFGLDQVLRELFASERQRDVSKKAVADVEDNQKLIAESKAQNTPLNPPSSGEFTRSSAPDSPLEVG
ncbi:MAG: penicillin acylase family protein, partial [bacterium]